MSRILEKQLTDYLVTDQARFYRLAYSYLKDREEALDAVQTAVCRALEKQHELKDSEALRAWFYHILVNVCMDVLRRRKRVMLVPPEALDTGSYEDPMPSDGTLAQRVDALPPEVGTIIKLRFYMPKPRPRNRKPSTSRRALIIKLTVEGEIGRKGLSTTERPLTPPKVKLFGNLK